MQGNEMVGRTKAHQTLAGWWVQLDQILRGDATRSSALRSGTIRVSIGGLLIVVIILGMSYGACMGCFALFKGGGPTFMQLVASMVKVPALFVLTLAITLPSLYVFNALVGSRLTLESVVALLVASLSVMLAVLASLGPIVAFFSVSTTSYAFMVLLNVVVFGVSGVLGLMFLLQTLHRLSPDDATRDSRSAVPAARPEPRASESEQPSEPIVAESGGALERLDDRVLGRHVKTVFRLWVIVFGLVGAQMGWVLRPFIGDPDRPFAWFRARESNFFEAVWQTFVSLLMS